MKVSIRNQVAAIAVLVLVTAALVGQTASQTKLALPIQKIEQTVGAEGSVENGVFHISISRKDIGNVSGPEDHPVTFTPDFMLDGDLFFQPLAGGRALLNADLPLRQQETNPFIAALVRNGLFVQAYHQHLPMKPQIWFVHFRGVGEPLALARAVRAALDTTKTPLPQPMSKSSSPLEPDKLAQILHGHASVGDKGVVTVWVYRRDRITIDGIQVNPQANISTNIAFKPTGTGSNADVVPDFAMTAAEINPVINLMENRFGWYQGCLYNQETAENPQLYFDHMLKSGDAYQLAREIRQGLDLTDAEGNSQRKHADIAR